VHRFTSKIAAIVAFAAAGFLLAASTLTANGSDIRVERPAQLRDLVQNQANKIDKLENNLIDIQSEIESITNGSARSEIETTQIKIKELSPVAGFTSMVGPGLVITLNDAPQVDLSIPESERPDVNDLLIHQEDVQSVVNALWAGGAQGVSLMGKRVIATSAVKCVGNTLLLHGKVYSPPFRIEAVGDVAKLTKSLKDDANVAILQDYVDLFGLVFEVQRSALIELPPYEGSLLLDNVQVKRNIS
jgi:uncharacterized protein YlxW (UPF0749 family)